MTEPADPLPGVGPTTAPARMRFSVDAWDPSYGTSSELEDELGESTARIDVDVERRADSWAPVDPAPGTPQPEAVLFVDGVRRIEARLWIDDVAVDGPATEASAALAASYAAGVVCCCKSGAHHLTSQTRRGLFTIAAHASDVATRAGTYLACRTAPSAATPLSSPCRRRCSGASANWSCRWPSTPAQAWPPTASATTTCSSSTGRCAAAPTCPGRSGSSRATGRPTCRRPCTR